jgi:anti-anti-sigma factor
MSIDFVQKNDWVYVPAPGRLDAFNFEAAKKELEDVARRTKQIAIDVSTVHFVSIPMIKFIHSLASEVARKGGRLALVGPTEKLKRQIHIFASRRLGETRQHQARRERLIGARPDTASKCASHF